MATLNKPGMISQMPELMAVDGNEFLEVIKRDNENKYINYRLLLSKVRNNEGKSAYEVAVDNGFIGSETEWLESLKGKSIYQLALEHGFEGTEQEYLDSLKGDKGDTGDTGRSAYELAVYHGFEGTEEDWLETLIGKSAYQVAVDSGFIGTQDEWLASLKGDPGPALTADALQELLNERSYTVRTYMRAIGENSGMIANAGFFNFLFTFDKRIDNTNLSSPNKVPQRSGEFGRMEEEGYSYWKNSGATTNQGTKLEDVPEEARLYDNGRFQYGTFTDYIEFGDGSNVVVVKNGEPTTYDLANSGSTGEDGKSAYEIAVEQGFSGDVNQWLDSLKGKSAYTSAVESGFSGTEEEWVESLQGKSAYQSALDGGFEGTEEEFNEALASPKGIAGGVFVTDVIPQSVSENTGDKVMSADGYSLISASSTTNEVIVRFKAITGHTNFRPNVTVNGIPATVTATLDSPTWNGEAAITLPEPDEDNPVIVTVVHEDGATFKTEITMDTAPVVLSAIFSSGLPGNQTELKATDLMSISFETDQPVVGYEIENTGAFVATSGNLPSGTEHEVNNLVIANRGNIATLHGFRIRVRKASGSWSNWYDSSAVGSIEGVDVVTLNNTRPVINFGNITYPDGQGAIKSGDSATVVNTILNADTVNYTSSNGQLTITSPTVIEPNKTVTYLAGSYNETTDNITITANRVANGSSTTASSVVRISNVLPQLTVTLPAARLRSGGNNGTQVQRHVVTITSNQTLAEAPSINVPEGTWEEAGWVGSGNRKVWTRGLLVSDTDVKGEYSFNSVIATGLAGLVQNTLQSGNDYVLGGFVFRVLNVPAYPNREAVIGTEVVDTSKLRCSNLSKGSSGSLNFTYKSNNEDAPDMYTIAPNGNWYNCDALNAVSNTQGMMQIEIEEVV